MEYYLRYTIASSIIFFFTALANFLSGVFTKGTTGALVVQSIGNASKLCTPLVLSFIRYKDPLIEKVMKRLVFFWRRKQKDDSDYKESVLEEFMFHEVS